MRINDFHNILELIKQDILQSEVEYLKLLKVVGNNQKYDFRSQLSIYDKNPKATACAKFDYWREHFNRTVMRGQKGIPILEDYGTYKKVDYIFDISQTVSKNRDVNEVNLWRFDKETHRDVLKEMIKGIAIFHDIGKVNPNYQVIKIGNKEISRNEAFIDANHSFISSISYLSYFRSKLMKEVSKKKIRDLMKEFLLYQRRVAFDLFHAFLKICDRGQCNGGKPAAYPCGVIREHVFI